MADANAAEAGTDGSRKAGTNGRKSWPEWKQPIEKQNKMLFAVN
ncbi:hypothetical protein [Methanimicrococcus hacksteinii]|nr:hypothetical protein [Methanimicrococcus sp. At1]